MTTPARISAALAAAILLLVLLTSRTNASHAYLHSTTCTTVITTSTSQVLCSLNLGTIQPGLYELTARVPIFASTSGGNLGSGWLRVNTTKCGKSQDWRFSVSGPNNAAGFLHCSFNVETAASYTVDVWFSREAGSTTFNCCAGGGEERFGTFIEVYGDLEVPFPTFPTFPPYPEATGPMTIEAFTGTAADSVDQLLLVIGVGIVLMGCLLAAILVAAGLRR